VADPESQQIAFERTVRVSAASGSSAAELRYTVEAPGIVVLKQNEGREFEKLLQVVDEWVRDFPTLRMMRIVSDSIHLSSDKHPHRGLSDDDDEALHAPLPKKFRWETGADDGFCTEAMKTAFARRGTSFELDFRSLASEHVHELARQLQRHTETLHLVPMNAQLGYFRHPNDAKLLEHQIQRELVRVVSEVADHGMRLSHVNFQPIISLRIAEADSFDGVAHLEGYDQNFDVCLDATFSKSRLTFDYKVHDTALEREAGTRMLGALKPFEAPGTKIKISAIDAAFQAVGVDVEEELIEPIAAALRALQRASSARRHVRSIPDTVQQVVRDDETVISENEGRFILSVQMHEKVEPRSGVLGVMHGGDGGTTEITDFGQAKALFLEDVREFQAYGALLMEMKRRGQTVP
jgi:hypothetical protein